MHLRHQLHQTVHQTTPWDHWPWVPPWTLQQLTRTLLPQSHGHLVQLGSHLHHLRHHLSGNIEGIIPNMLLAAAPRTFLLTLFITDMPSEHYYLLQQTSEKTNEYGYSITSIATLITAMHACHRMFLHFLHFARFLETVRDFLRYSISRFLEIF